MYKITFFLTNLHVFSFLSIQIPHHGQEQVVHPSCHHPGESPSAATRPCQGPLAKPRPRLVGAEAGGAALLQDKAPAVPELNGEGPVRQQRRTGSLPHRFVIKKFKVNKS